MLYLFHIEFAYSLTMQIILACITFGCTFLCHYMISTLILTLYGDTVSPRRRMLFSFFIGTILSDVWVYGLYLLGVTFTPLVFALVTVPNPFMALLYYYFGIKTLRLSPIRSIRIVCHVYLYIMAYKSIVYLMNYLFFDQPLDGAYNYMLEAYAVLVGTALTLMIAYFTILFVRKKKFMIDLRDTIRIKSVPFELVRCFALSAFSYMAFALPRFDEHANHFIGYSSAVISTVLIFFSSLLWDIYRVTETKRANKAAYVNALVKTTDDFRAFRHDFKNVLQTYGGYVSLNDMDGLRRYHEAVVTNSMSADLQFELTRRLEECPPKVLLFLEKLAYAKEAGVDFQMITSGELYKMGNHFEEIKYCISCLLDNAIEAAAESERKMVLYSREIKENGNELVVITNSTRDDVQLNKFYEPGFSTKQNHMGFGLNIARNIIDKIPCYTLHMTYYQHEFSVYIEAHRTTDMHYGQGASAIISMTENDCVQFLPDDPINLDFEVDFTNLTLLLVDDNTFLMDTVKKYLESLHVVVDTAENGLAGLELFQMNPDKYDIIFLDITMPVMDGIEAAKRIREANYPAVKTIPLIAITGNLLPDQAKTHLFDDILHKPFSFDKLKMIIKKHILMKTTKC